MSMQNPPDGNIFRWSFDSGILQNGLPRCDADAGEGIAAPGPGCGMAGL
jgi:hypothetical protein